MWFYILKRRSSADYDETAGVVVRARDAAQARKIASTAYGVEGPNVWLDSRHTSVERLYAYGKAEVILVDFHAG